MNSRVSKAGFGIGASLKGTGEGGTVAPPTVVANALCDALAPLGVEGQQRTTHAPADSCRARKGPTTAEWHEEGR